MPFRRFNSQPRYIVATCLVLACFATEIPPCFAGLKPIGVAVGPWTAGGSGTLTALFIETDGAQSDPPAFEFCAMSGVNFGTPTVLYPPNTTVAPVSGNDCWTEGGFNGTAFAIPGRTGDAARQVWRLRVPFTVPAGYAGAPNGTGGPLDPGTLLLQVLGALGTPGGEAASVPPKPSGLRGVGSAYIDTEETIVRSRSSTAT